jgi:hypothetical protein
MTPPATVPPEPGAEFAIFEAPRRRPFGGGAGCHINRVDFPIVRECVTFRGNLNTRLMFMGVLPPPAAVAPPNTLNPYMWY